VQLVFTQKKIGVKKQKKQGQIFGVNKSRYKNKHIGLKNWCKKEENLV